MGLRLCLQVCGRVRSGFALTPGTFGALASGTWEPLFWQFGVLAVTTAIIAAGVSRGIEKVTKTLMPLLFILLIVCDIRALTLHGASAGVVYLFKPDLSKLTGAVLLSALGLAFFKLSLGMGTMTTYGPIFPIRHALFPTRRGWHWPTPQSPSSQAWPSFRPYSLLEAPPAGGPGLLFNTIPLIFSKMPPGGLFIVLFFILTAIATIGAMVSLIEVPVAWIVEKGNMKRPVAAVITGGLMFLLGILATLSQSTCWPM